MPFKLLMAKGFGFVQQALINSNISGGTLMQTNPLTDIFTQFFYATNQQLSLDNDLPHDAEIAKIEANLINK